MFRFQFQTHVPGVAPVGHTLCVKTAQGPANEAVVFGPKLHSECDHIEPRCTAIGTWVGDQVEAPRISRNETETSDLRQDGLITGCTQEVRRDSQFLAVIVARVVQEGEELGAVVR